MSLIDVSFINEVLEKLKNGSMTIDEFKHEILVVAYEHDVRRNLFKYPKFVGDVVNIVEYNTEIFLGDFHCFVTGGKYE